MLNNLISEYNVKYIDGSFTYLSISVCLLSSLLKDVVPVSDRRLLSLYQETLDVWLLVRKDILVYVLPMVQGFPELYM